MADHPVHDGTPDYGAKAMIARCVSRIRIRIASGGKHHSQFISEYLEGSLATRNEGASQATRATITDSILAPDHRAKRLHGNNCTSLASLSVEAELSAVASCEMKYDMALMRSGGREHSFAGRYFRGYNISSPIRTFNATSSFFETLIDVQTRRDDTTTLSSLTIRSWNEPERERFVTGGGGGAAGAPITREARARTSEVRVPQVQKSKDKVRWFTCNSCHEHSTECIYVTKEGEDRWAALNRRNTELEHERDQLRGLFRTVQSCPETIALEVYRYMRENPTESIETLASNIEGVIQRQQNALQLPPLLSVVEGQGLDRNIIKK
ncbi:hypothetical protein Q7P37_004022 [Cladosporium fusiforme]